MMQKTTTDNNYCWVFISRDKNAPQQLYIGMAADLPQLFQKNTEREVLYYRQFASAVEGVSHKLFLTHVERDTLWHTIRGMNPVARDLKEEFFQISYSNK